MPPVTASMLYNLIACPHRVTQDLFGNPVERDDVSPFAQLLWERGTAFERETIGGLTFPYLDLSGYAGEEKERQTLAAMQRGEPLIYSGRIQADDLLGDPDLLRREGSGYVAGDIKSGSGEEGPEDLSRPKVHYAVQVALYTDILERIGLSAGRHPFIWDIHGREVLYDLDATRGSKDPSTLWSDYQACLVEARQIVSGASQTLPAYGGVCKECHWYTACQKQLAKADDLTLMFDLGRSKRDVLHNKIPTMQALAEINPDAFITGKKTVFRGIGPDTLVRLHERAKLLKTPNPRPYLRIPVQMPHSALEVFFDIEVDPMHDHTYLHGFIERRNCDNATEQYTGVFADSISEQAERDAFGRAWGYLRERPSAVVYFYSPYERTYWRKLRERYPEVWSEADLESLFGPARSVDLYTDVVRKATEWPTRDYSIKTLAKSLGFKWRDAHPSGAASIEWFARWIETGDPTVKQRILDYNEDDCRATRWLLDGIRAMASR
jgi:predicted RecB family nuclease